MISDYDNYRSEAITNRCFLIMALKKLLLHVPYIATID